MPGPAVIVPSLSSVTLPLRSSAPGPVNEVVLSSVSVFGLLVSEARFLVLVPLMTVGTATSRLPSTLPPVHSSRPVPMNPPVPEKDAPPLSWTVVLAPMDTFLPTEMAAFWSNSSVPPPLMLFPPARSPGPVATSSNAPVATETEPWSSKSAKVTFAVPAFGKDSLPVLVNLSGDTQQAPARIDVPGSIVKVPVLVMFDWLIPSTPDPLSVVAPCSVSVIRLPFGDASDLNKVPLMAVLVATSMLAEMVPPVHRNSPPPVTPPVPVNEALPVSWRVVPVPMVM